jgi:hypothetical protein
MLAHGCALARRACQPAARPSRRVWRGAVGRLLGRKCEEEENDKAGGWGQAVIRRKEKEERC